MKVYPVGIVGESKYQAAIRRTHPGEVARVCFEPDNPFDSDALRVENNVGDTIGYISRTSWLRRAIVDDGMGCAATIKSISDGEGGTLGVVIDVTLTDDSLPERAYGNDARAVEKPGFFTRTLRTALGLDTRR